jgi:peptidoglycan/LPS O-acetylase OafA/YrhL
MINNIQALRAFAAMNVVLFHVIALADIYDRDVWLLSPLYGWGSNGVDVFFVISGFVITLSQSKTPRSCGAFLYNRIIRIAPIYWFLTLSLVIMFIALPSAFRSLEISGEHVVHSLLFTSHLALGERPVLYLGWTLEWEMLFYALFAVSLYAERIDARLGVPVLMGLVAAVMVYDVLILEFVLGLLAAHIYRKTRLTKAAGLSLFLAGTAGLVASSVFAPDYATLHRLLMWGLPSFFLVLGAAVMGQMSARPVLTLGAASYSIYLVQMFTIPAFYKAMDAFALTIPADLAALLCLALSTLAGYLLFRYVETPLMRILRAAKPLRSATVPR